jgi:hypothetical protein
MKTWTFKEIDKTAKEIDKLEELKGHLKLSHEEIAERMDMVAQVQKLVGQLEAVARDEAAAIQVKLSKQAAYKKPPPDQPDDWKERKCLMCGCDFQSVGNKNRVCKKCKSLDSWTGQHTALI